MLRLICATAFLLASVTAGRALTVTCPETLDGQPFDFAGVFDGPPARGHDVVPDHGGWDLARRPRSREGYFLFCHYKGTKATKLLPLPRSIFSCVFEIMTGPNSWTPASCSSPQAK